MIIVWFLAMIVEDFCGSLTYVILPLWWTVLTGSYPERLTHWYILDSSDIIVVKICL